MVGWGTKSLSDCLIPVPTRFATGSPTLAGALGCAHGGPEAPPEGISEGPPKAKVSPIPQRKLASCSRTAVGRPAYTHTYTQNGSAEARAKTGASSPFSQDACVEALQKDLVLNAP